VVNSRRVARELALKVIFQVDVGKQPLDEVLEGAFDQIRQTVDQPVGQVIHDAQVALRQLAAERTEDLSAQSAKQIRTITTASLTHLRTLAERASERTRRLMKTASESAAETAEQQMTSDSEITGAELRKLAARDSYQSKILAEITDASAAKAQQIVAIFGKHIRAASLTAEFTQMLVHGVREKQEEIDARIAGLSAGWALDRQAAVDRNIMRLAAYEILYLPDIPMGASINEAVELAKKYSTAESGRFVNGVLGALAANPEGKAAAESEVAVPLEDPLIEIDEENLGLGEAIGG
jgi:transcription antitermination factor NusB